MMSQRAKLRFLIFFLDGIGLELAFYATFYLRFRTGLFINPVHFYAVDLLLPSVVLWLFWIFIGAFFDLYRFDPVQGRKEIAAYVLRTTAVGTILLFLVTFEYSDPLPLTRVILLTYFGLVYLVLAGGRVLLLTILKFLRRRGVGLSPTLLIGTGERAREFLNLVKQSPDLGFRLVGVASEGDTTAETWESLPMLGTARNMPLLRMHHFFNTVLLALDPPDEAML
ncbi:hypothetical protein KKG05_04865, partial [bacterium]|nr:hypothetical protein [bacterium]